MNYVVIYFCLGIRARRFPTPIYPSIGQNVLEILIETGHSTFSNKAHRQQNGGNFFEPHQ